ncbi:MAG: family 10 glycosylhydrolase, partial [Acidobacteriota bacterium]
MRRHFAAGLLAGVILLLGVRPVGGREVAPASVEIRAVWLDRSSLVSRQEIRSTLEQLASANFNLVLVNVWSRGYPLWPSGVFARESGLSIDPEYVGRDPLAEVIE